ncbi:hypothetical protein [Pseudomonas sp. SMN5]|uniref:hypothetical protein n=1 Tax=Pseudomonas sp. SMN5 TaxID=3390198 RepID=UPI003F84DC5D
MSEIPDKFGPQEAMLLGLIKAVQALTAVTYHTSPKRDALEEQFKIYLDKETGFDGERLRSYRAPLEGMLKIINDIKEAQTKG